jgi:hypothetical protein
MAGTRKIAAILVADIVAYGHISSRARKRNLGDLPALQVRSTLRRDA